MYVEREVVERKGEKGIVGGEGIDKTRVMTGGTRPSAAP
jgi:hypothetical protein